LFGNTGNGVEDAIQMRSRGVYHFSKSGEVFPVEGIGHRAYPVVKGVSSLDELGGKLWRRVASLPADMALGVTNMAPIASYLDQRRIAREETYVSASSLSANETAVVNGLQRSGVFVTSLENLGIAQVENASILASGARITDVLADRIAALNQPSPAFICNEPGDLLANPPIYRWGLNATVLRIIESYLRQPVAYDGPIVFYTEANKAEYGTRRWHLDREDRRVVKVALYLHDVDDEGDGRFKYPVVTTATLERLLDIRVNTLEPVTCTGKAGTLVFAEAGRFYHRGKPPTANDRVAIFYGYFARPPRNPFYCERSRLSRPQIMQLIEGLAPEQRASALWRDVLPWPVRMIPASAR
jgi:hypothetical protein